MAGSSYATASRRKILEYLKNSNDHTVTAADVDEYLKKHDSEVNITTIYRYLDKLAGEQRIMKYVADKGWNCDQICCRERLPGCLSVCRTGTGM